MSRTSLAIVILLIYTPAWGATYYVDARGGNDSNSGTATNTPWKTINKVNTSSFSAGDSILFKRGETWREQLTIPSSGSAGNVISFGAYGSGVEPIISGADIVTSWIADSVVGNVYNAIVAAQPKQIFKNGTRIALGTSKGALNDQEWFAAGTTLSMRDDSGNLGSQAYVISASVRDFNINENGKNNIFIHDLNLTMANQQGVYFGSAADNVIINANTISNSYKNGIRSVTGAESKNITVRGNTINWQGGSGVALVKTSHDWIIEHNTIHNFSQIQTTDVDLEFSGGIRVWCDDNTVKNLTIQNNTVYNGGLLPNGSTYVGGSRGIGIWLDTIKGHEGNVIRYNKVYNCNYIGIHLEFSDNVTVYYNLIYGINYGYGIRVGAYSNITDVKNNRIYNNVSYNNTYGCFHAVGRTDATADSFVGNIFKNNIGYGCARNLVAEYGGENDGTMGNRNIYTYNHFGVEGGSIIEWGHGVKISTYSDWESAYGDNTHSVQKDPLFVNAGGGDFHLQSSSPAINAGTNVLLTNDYDGNHVPFGGAPDIGAFEYQGKTKIPLPPRSLNIE